MKAFIKKLTASVLITAITAAMTGNVYAAEPEAKAYVQVAGNN